MQFTSTKNLNEAVFYTLFGGIIKDITIKKIKTRKYADTPKMIQNIFKFDMLVPKEIIDKWWYNKAVYNIREYMDKRTEIKRICLEKANKAHVNRFVHHV